MQYIRFVRALFLGLFLSALSTQAAVLPVTTLADTGPGSLRGQIQAANTNDTLDLQGLTGRILLDSMLLVQKNLTWLGPGIHALSIDGQGLTRHIELADDDTLLISGLRFVDGSALGYPFPGGGSVSNQGFLEASYCLWENNAAGYGGAIVNSRSGQFATLVLRNCAFVGNTATPDQPNPGAPGPPQGGGAIYGDGQFPPNDSASSVVRAFNCTFSHNAAGDLGGAIFMVGDITGGTEFRALHCTLSANEAPEGGAITNFKFAGIVLQNSLVAGNISFADPDIQGGAVSEGFNVIGELGNSSLIPLPTDFVEEEAGVGSLSIPPLGLPYHPLICGSPAIDAAGPSSLTADQNDRPYLNGADIGAFERDASLDGLVLNRAESGYGSLRQAIELACPGDTVDMSGISGVIRLRSTLVLDKDIFLRGNQDRALIISGEDSLRIFEIQAKIQVGMNWMSLRRGGPALYGGGAIQNRGNLSLAHMTLSGNQAEAGGAIANYADQGPATVSAINCTFGHNTAQWLDGGAIDNRSFTDAAQVRLLHCTLAENIALKRGGGISTSGELAQVWLQNTLIGLNQAETGADLFGTYQSEGHNFYSNDLGFILENPQMEVFNTDPELFPLDFYGGPTQTFRLNNLSEAIDNGRASAAITIDQRGEARGFNGTPDIGAYEFDPATNLSDLLQPIAFRLYPNPTRQQVWFQSEGAGSWTLTLVDLLGRIHFRQQLQNTAAPRLLDLPPLVPGLYLVIGEHAGTRHVTRLKIE